MLPLSPTGQTGQMGQTPSVSAVSSRRAGVRQWALRRRFGGRRPVAGTGDVEPESNIVRYFGGDPSLDDVGLVLATQET